jgi:hypothetical protein
MESVQDPLHPNFPATSAAAGSRLGAARTLLLWAFGAALLAAPGARAQAIAWSNAAGGLWTTASNWTPAGEPGAANNVSISAHGTYTVLLEANDTVESLQLDDPGATLAMMNSVLTLSNSGGSSAIAAGTVTMSGSEIVGSSSSGTYSLFNAGTIKATSKTSYIFGSQEAATILAFTNTGRVDVTGGILYLGRGLLAGAGGGSVALENAGVVDVTGGSLEAADGSNDTVSNSGTIEANGGNVLLGSSSSTVSNLSQNTLTGGTWIAASGGTLTLSNGANVIATNGARTVLVLSGATSSIESGPSSLALQQTLLTNNGTLEVLSGANFASTSSGLTNNGVLQLGGGTLTASSLGNGSGSAITGFGTLNPTGGVAIGPGVLISPGNAVHNQYLNTLSFGSNGGSLGTGGTYAFDIMDSASPVPGTDNDTISVAGALNVGATASDPFTIALESINPGTGLPGLASFSPTGTYQWTLVSATMITGFNPSDFRIDTRAFSNGLGSGSFFLSATGTDIYLNFTPVPEPAAWELMALGAAAVGLFSRRRGRN